MSVNGYWVMVSIYRNCYNKCMRPVIWCKDYIEAVYIKDHIVITDDDDIFQYQFEVWDAYEKNYLIEVFDYRYGSMISEDNPIETQHLPYYASSPNIVEGEYFVDTDDRVYRTNRFEDILLFENDGFDTRVQYKADIARIRMISKKSFICHEIRKIILSYM